jgi:hypothetical protein
MEKVPEIYRRAYNPLYHVVCMDESPKQLIGETKTPVAAKPGSEEKHDYEYERRGVCNIFMANGPLRGKCTVKITERKTKTYRALFVEDISNKYPEAEKITLVMDNCDTHKAGAFYETFAPEKAKALRDRFEFIFTPKHGSWLNMAGDRVKCLNGTMFKSTN